MRYVTVTLCGMLPVPRSLQVYESIQTAVSASMTAVDGRSSLT